MPDEPRRDGTGSRADLGPEDDLPTGRRRRSREDGGGLSVSELLEQHSRTDLPRPVPPDGPTGRRRLADTEDRPEHRPTPPASATSDDPVGFRRSTPEADRRGRRGGRRAAAEQDGAEPREGGRRRRADDTPLSDPGLRPERGPEARRARLDDGGRQTAAPGTDFGRTGNPDNPRRADTRAAEPHPTAGSGQPAPDEPPGRRRSRPDGTDGRARPDRQTAAENGRGVAGHGRPGPADGRRTGEPELPAPDGGRRTGPGNGRRAAGPDLPAANGGRRALPDEPDHRTGTTAGRRTSEPEPNGGRRVLPDGPDHRGEAGGGRRTAEPEPPAAHSGRRALPDEPDQVRTGPRTEGGRPGRADGRRGADADGGHRFAAEDEEPGRGRPQDDGRRSRSGRGREADGGRRVPPGGQGLPPTEPGNGRRAPEPGPRGRDLPEAGGRPDVGPRLGEVDDGGPARRAGDHDPRRLAEPDRAGRRPEPRRLAEPDQDPGYRRGPEDGSGPHRLPPGDPRQGPDSRRFAAPGDPRRPDGDSGPRRRPDQPHLPAAEHAGQGPGPDTRDRPPAPDPRRTSESGEPRSGVPGPDSRRIPAPDGPDPRRSSDSRRMPLPGGPVPDADDLRRGAPGPDGPDSRRMPPDGSGPRRMPPPGPNGPDSRRVPRPGGPDPRRGPDPDFDRAEPGRDGSDSRRMPLPGHNGSDSQRMPLPGHNGPEPGRDGSDSRRMPLPGNDGPGPRRDGSDSRRMPLPGPNGADPRRDGPDSRRLPDADAPDQRRGASDSRRMPAPGPDGSDSRRMPVPDLDPRGPGARRPHDAEGPQGTGHTPRRLAADAEPADGHVPRRLASDGPGVADRLAGTPNGDSQSSGPQSSGPQNAGPQNAGPQNAGPQNAGPQNAGPQNGAQNSGPRNAGHPDQGRPPGGPKPPGPDPREGIDPASLTTEMEVISDEVAKRREVDHTLARFSAVHDELAEQERLRKERRQKLMPWKSEADEDATQYASPVDGDDEEGPARRERSPKHKRIVRLVKIVALAAAVLVFVSTGLGWGAMVYLDSKIQEIKALPGDDKNVHQAEKQLGDENFLIVGSDTRAGAKPEDGVGTEQKEKGARSDVLMLAHIPADRKRVVVVWVPRDLRITRPACERWDYTTGQYTGEQLEPAEDVLANEAYADGGPLCVTKFMTDLTGLKINHFVSVDFNGFKGMVDAVGSVEVCVPKVMEDGKLGMIFDKPGKYEISGQKALDYVRARYVLNEQFADYDRIERQKKFLSALLKKVLSSETLLSPGKLKAFMEAFAASTSGENIGVNDMLTLAESLQGLEAGRVSFITVPHETSEGPTPSPNDNKELLKLPETKTLFQAVIDGLPLPGETPAKQTQPSTTGSAEKPAPKQGKVIDPKQVKVQVRNSENGVGGAAATTAEALQGLGFDVVFTGSAPSVDKTVIRYATGREDWAATLKAAIPDSELVLDESMGGAVQLVLSPDWDEKVVPPQAGASDPDKPTTPKDLSIVNAASDPCA
ncbi:hypothetical protein GCM10022243_51180 [Saccharothrix violaceirubra]|uniref:LCP family protein required for cell wall assembly n=1 Tax=Saccharothrix violaceirubra TaxID=413306 RepID=A0A7W7SX92_9PSEU|nr:LCP family protein [Saccharothrix violaceirubra]MBB4962668.1 LCP family protein required for cell wall assembly [Saccharothrix violaceirubra]